MSALPEAHDVRRTLACSAANSAPVRPKPVAISSRTSSSAVLVAQLAQQPRRTRAGEKRMPPAPCTTGSTITPASSCACARTSRRTSAAHSSSHTAGGRGAKTCSAQRPREQRVHPADGVADRHRAERVAVVAAADGQQPSRRSPCQYCRTQLDRDLDRDRPGVGEEHVIERRSSRTSRSASRTAGSCVSPPNITCAMRLELLAHRRVEHRVAVAVDRAPPRRHPVDQLAPVGEREPHALRRHHRQRRRRRRHRPVRVPDTAAVEVEQRVPGPWQQFLSRRLHGGNLLPESLGHVAAR